MKKFMLIGLVLAAVLALGSCGEKGGTITVKNDYTISASIITVTPTIKVSVAKVLDVAGALKFEEIEAGKSKTYNFDDDGTYNITIDPATTTACTLLGLTPPTANPKSVTLKGGNSGSVSIK